MKILFNVLIFLEIIFSQNLFDLYNVHNLDIEFYNPNYDQILKNRWEVDDKTYELATIVFNGDTLDSVGVRYKGNSTYYFTAAFESPKFPLNIDLDLIYNDQDILGYNKVKLSNSIFDPTFVKENLGYLTQSYYLPTPETGYMTISINGEELGLYTSVESINKSFLTKHFGNSDGTFFKCEPQFQFGEVYDADPNLVWYGEDSLDYEYQMGYELKSESGWNDLLDLIYTLNFNIDNIENVLNVDRALWFFASSMVMPDLDNYTGMYIHNYYLYKNSETNLFEVIPWDKDQTFGNVMVNTLIQWGGNVSWVYDWDPFLYENEELRPLFSKLMEVPIYKQLYTAHLRTILDEIYNAEYIQNLAYGIQDSIETYSMIYPNVWPWLNIDSYFQYNVDNYLVTGDGTNFCGIIPTVINRRDYLYNHPEIMKIPPVIEYVFQENINPNVGETVIIQSEISNAESVELMITTNQFSGQFFSIPMFDDGNHNDGEADDNIYAAEIPFQDSGVQVRYYVRASNSDAVILEPETAERDFYYYLVGNSSLPDSTVVINEINYNSLDNYDSGDWVELHNPTENDINLSNWIFKDEDDSHEFIIPDNTILDQGQYLVLVDDSTNFSQHHTNTNILGNLNFGFSGGGENLRLYNSQSILIDTVLYDDSDPWPSDPDGEGPTLELINPLYDNAIGESWTSSMGFGTPGYQNSSVLKNEMVSNLPDKFFLFNNYPNPFNPSTIISYNLPKDSHVNISIFDVLGRKVKTLTNQYMKAGKNKVQWNGENDHGKLLAAGVYIYKIISGGYNQSKKMILVK